MKKKSELTQEVRAYVDEHLSKTEKISGYDLAKGFIDKNYPNQDILKKEFVLITLKVSNYLNLLYDDEILDFKVVDSFGAIPKKMWWKK